jgi:hypothetical protein
MYMCNWVDYLGGVCDGDGLCDSQQWDGVVF